jgi:hypothetical protein
MKEYMMDKKDLKEMIGLRADTDACRTDGINHRVFKAAK